MTAVRLGLPLVTGLMVLALLDLLGAAMAAHLGAHIGGLSAVGVLGLLPAPLDGWLSPSPVVLRTTGGLFLLAGLALACALASLACSRIGADRLGGLAGLTGVSVALAVWSPLGLTILGGQAVLVGLVGRTAADPRTGAVIGMARLLGLAAAVLTAGPAVPGLVVTLLAAALAPDALAALRRAPTDPSRQEREAETETETETRADPSAIPADLGWARASTPVDPPTTPAPAPPRSEPAPVSDQAPDPDPEAAAPPPSAGLFGHDPVSALAHLTPAETLVSAARAALAKGETSLLVVARLDGLAGIAEHLGVGGGEALFATATERLASALPADSLLAWIGDETFAALITDSGTIDLEALCDSLAAPFAEHLMVAGRPISMEDALHVDATALNTETFEELARWVSDGAAG